MQAVTCCWLAIIWILGSGSSCPKSVKAEESYHTHERISALIKVCSESALKSLSIEAKGVAEDEQSEWHWLAPKHWLSSNTSTKFLIRVGEPKCMFPDYQILKRQDDEEVGYNSSMVYFYPNGYFHNDKDIFAPDEYCIESFTPQPSAEEGLSLSLKVKLCKPDCGLGKKRPCIKKCCPLDKILNIGKRFKCVYPPSGSVPFMPPFYDDFHTKSKFYNSSPLHNFSPAFPQFADALTAKRGQILLPHFTINYPKIFRTNCKKNVVVALPSSETTAQVLSNRTEKIMHSSMFRIRTDGAIMYLSVVDKFKCESMSMNLDTFCIDGVSGAFDPSDLDSPFNNTEDEYIIFQCQIAEKDPNADKYLSFTFGVLLISTSIFHFVTSLVYLLLWKKQNVHGWTIGATSGSFFFMYVLQGSAHLIGVTLERKALNTPYCILLGILVHFFMMSTFTWCSVMTFDLFITFRSVVPMNQRLQGVSRYVKYSLFGWGVPTLAVIIGVVMDFMIYNSTDCRFHAVPGYGVQNCWIMEDSLGEYLYYPAGFLLCVNIALFTATCVKLCMYGRGTTVRARKNNEAFGECFSRFSKLFCVMGISWIFEILSWYVDGLGFVWYWNILDVFNILRAVAVFAIYVCKNDIIKQLEDSYPTLKRMYQPFGRLILRKCSDEISTESTVLSAIPNSPAIQLKAVNNACSSESRGNKKSKEKKDADAVEL